MLVRFAMILTCPSCSSRYHVDSASFSPQGRKVRCANCGHRWKARPPADLPQSVDLELAPPSERPRAKVKAAAAAAATPPPARRRLPESKAAGAPALSMSWLLGGALVVLLLVSMIIGRNGIVDKVPASASIYQTLGFSIEQERGLEFTDVTSDWQVEGGASAMVVEGQIVNLSDATQVIPPIRIAILDGEGRELQHEFVEIDKEVLSGGGRISFSGRLVNPIDEGENFRLTFEQAS